MELEKESLDHKMWDDLDIRNRNWGKIEGYIQNEIDNKIEDLGLKIIVESGSNSNGTYIRFGDGTQVCYQELGDYTYTLSGNSSGNIDFTYPKPFIERPSLSGSGDPLGTQGVDRIAWLNFRSFSQSVARIKVHNRDSSSIGEIRGLSYKAIGKWK